MSTPSEKVANYIKNSGIKQTYLSKKTGIHISSLNAKVNGNIKFSVEEIEVLCWALKVDLNTFLTPHPPKYMEIKRA